MDASDINCESDRLGGQQENVNDSSVNKVNIKCMLCGQNISLENEDYATHLEEVHYVNSFRRKWFVELALSEQQQNLPYPLGGNASASSETNSKNCSEEFVIDPKTSSPPAKKDFRKQIKASRLRCCDVKLKNLKGLTPSVMKDLAIAFLPSEEKDTATSAEYLVHEDLSDTEPIPSDVEESIMSADLRDTDHLPHLQTSLDSDSDIEQILQIQQHDMPEHTTENSGQTHVWEDYKSSLEPYTDTKETTNVYYNNSKHSDDSQSAAYNTIRRSTNITLKDEGPTDKVNDLNLIRPKEEVDDSVTIPKEDSKMISETVRNVMDTSDSRIAEDLEHDQPSDNCSVGSDQTLEDTCARSGSRTSIFSADTDSLSDITFKTDSQHHRLSLDVTQRSSIRVIARNLCKQDEVDPKPNLSIMAAKHKIRVKGGSEEFTGTREKNYHSPVRKKRKSVGRSRIKPSNGSCDKTMNANVIKTTKRSSSGSRASPSTRSYPSVSFRSKQETGATSDKGTPTKSSLKKKTRANLIIEDSSSDESENGDTGPKKRSRSNSAYVKNRSPKKLKLNKHSPKVQAQHHKVGSSADRSEDCTRLEGLVAALKENNKVVSSNLKDVCRFWCELCSSDINYNMLRFHLKINHNTTLEKYDEQYGIKISRAVYHACFKCGEEVVSCKVNLREHISIHDMDLKSYEEELNSRLENKDSLSHSQSRTRRKSDERQPEKGLKERNSSSESGKHLQPCHIKDIKPHQECTNGLKEKENKPQNRRRSLHRSHLKSHSMKLPDKKQLKLESSASSNKSISCAGSLNSDKESSLCVSLNEAIEENKVETSFFSSSLLHSEEDSLPPEYVTVDSKRAEGVESKMVDESTENTDISDETLDAESSARFSDIPGDYMRYLCGICEFEGDYRQMQKHLKRFHDIQLRDFRRKHGELKIKEKIYHKCKICNFKMHYIRDSLLSHANKKHDMTVQEYVKSYLEPNEECPTSNQNPSANKGGHLSLSTTNYGEESGIEHLAKEPSCDENMISDCKLEEETTIKDESPKDTDVDSSGKIKGVKVEYDNSETESANTHLTLDLTRIKSENPSGTFSEEVKMENCYNTETEFDNSEKETIQNESNLVKLSECDNESLIEDKESRRFSDVDGDYCVFYCHECRFQGYYYEIRIHIQKCHMLSPKKYKKKHGDLLCKKTVYHNCRECNKNVRYTSITSLSNHLQHHSMTRTEYFEKHFKIEVQRQNMKSKKARDSNSPGDYSSFQCHICSYAERYKQFVKHIKSKHKLTPKLYLRQYKTYRFNDKVVHQCKICSKEILYNHGELEKHLKEHNIEVNQYTIKHLSPKQSEKPTEPIQGNSVAFFEDVNGSLESAKRKRSSDINIEQLRMPKKKKVLKGSECAKSDHHTGSTGKFKEGWVVKKETHVTVVKKESIVSSEFDAKSFVGEWRFSDVDGDFCMFKCHECQFSGYSHQIKAHILNCHNMSTGQYIEVNGDLLCTDNVFHRCRECNSSVQYISNLLSLHLARNHSTTRAKYFEKHFNVKIYDQRYKEAKSQVQRTSDSPNDYALFQCQKCSYVHWYKQFVKHIQSEHKLSPQLYLERYNTYKFNNKVVHQCKICTKEILYYREELEVHLKQHSIGVNRYILKYLKTNQNEELEESSLSASTIDDERKIEDCPDNAVELSFKMEKGSVVTSNEDLSDPLASSSNETTNEESESRFVISDNTPKCLINEETGNGQPGDKISRLKDESADASTLVYDTTEMNGNKVKEDNENKHSDEAVNDVSIRFSDVPGDYTTYECHLCNFTGTYGELKNNIKIQHSLTITKYRQQNGDLKIVERVIHTCKICFKEMHYEQNNLYNHLKHHHSLSVDLYQERYLNGGKGPGTSSLKRKRSSDSIDKDPTVLQMARLLRAKKDSSEPESLTEDEPEDDTISEQSSAEDCGKNWYDGTEYFCSKCSFTGHSMDVMDNHLKLTHNVKSAKAQQSCYTVSNEKHECRYCKKKVLHDKTALKEHLDDHFLTLEKYEHLYINFTRTETKKNKSEKKSSEKAFHGFAVKEAKTAAKCKKVTRVKNLSEVMLSSEDEYMKQPRAEDTPADYYFPKINIEYRDIKPCKAEEMSCLVKDPSQALEDGFVYVCPLCAFQTTLQMLKSGVGSRHLRSDHNLSVPSFKKKKLGWKKVTPEQALKLLHFPDLKSNWQT